MKINISLPNFYYNAYINLFFIKLKKICSEYFYDNININVVDGVFPYSIWSLDRHNKYADKVSVIKILNIYKKYKVSVNYFFDNPCIDKTDLDDTYSNLLLKLNHHNNASIYLVSDILYEYIRKRYWKYKLIKIEKPYNSKKKDICIDSRFNSNISSFKFKEKSKTIITLNPICNCDYEHHERHIKYIAGEQIGFYDCSCEFFCPLPPNMNFYKSINNSDFVTLKSMKKYIDLGYKNFRIEAKRINNYTDVNINNYDVAESYIYYLIKPEYKDFVRTKLFKELSNKKEN